MLQDCSPPSVLSKFRLPRKNRTNNTLDPENIPHLILKL